MSGSGFQNPQFNFALLEKSANFGSFYQKAKVKSFVLFCNYMFYQPTTLLKWINLISDKFSECLVQLSLIECELDRLSGMETRSDYQVAAVTSGTMSDVDELSSNVAKLHLNLIILRNYQTTNVEAFQEIMRKHDKVSFGYRQF